MEVIHAHGADGTATLSRTMEECSSPVKPEAGLIKSSVVDGRKEARERDWAQEERMKELLAVTRGLLLHFPSSCRFNNGSSRDEDDWNTYVRAVLRRKEGGRGRERERGRGRKKRESVCVCVCVCL